MSQETFNSQNLEKVKELSVLGLKIKVLIKKRVLIESQFFEHPKTDHLIIGLMINKY